MSSTIDEVISAFYSAFDNRGGRRLTPETLRALFIPEARITRVSAAAVESWSVDEFITPRAAMLSDGTLTEFHEREIDAWTTALDHIASRHSFYEKSGTMRGQPYAGRGRKFIQLCRVDDAWRITAMLWEDE